MLSEKDLSLRTAINMLRASEVATSQISVIDRFGPDE